MITGFAAGDLPAWNLTSTKSIAARKCSCASVRRSAAPRGSSKRWLPSSAMCRRAAPKTASRRSEARERQCDFGLTCGRRHAHGGDSYSLFGQVDGHVTDRLTFHTGDPLHGGSQACRVRSDGLARSRHHRYFGFDASYRSEWYSDASVSQYGLIDGYGLLSLRAGFGQLRPCDRCPRGSGHGGPHDPSAFFT